ncbi:potassium-transporting ATPase subunit C [Nocardia blacklockiae]|uniref:potassium-transporting ATPase subunit C n=1 Tax=Nocardia blacklockiae TaxID=480036 RepID=UPI001895E358|nr:potassium-transporting ATPase subunit C [Nocardia blacklockiae]MBF6173777.1 potassium-transporting ATPase subunit C [Nocardia blacklockiae]
MRKTTWIRQHLAALRALLVLTVITGIAYPVAVFVVAQVPGLHDKAEGSLLERDGGIVGSSLIGQAFTDGNGNALPQYFQSRPSSSGKGDGYDPTATSFTNLGPESIVDTLAADPDDAKQSLLTQVCARSKAIGEREGVDGARPYCTPSGVGAVLAVFGPRDAQGTVPTPSRVVSVNEPCPTTPFLTTYRGVHVDCATPGDDYTPALTLPVRGNAPADPPVPPDAVVTSASGLDPDISPSYATLQIPRIAKSRNIPEEEVHTLVTTHTANRTLGFLGEPRVNVLELNLDLDRKYPVKG